MQKTLIDKWENGALWKCHFLQKKAKLLHVFVTGKNQSKRNDVVTKLLERFQKVPSAVKIANTCESPLL